MEIEGEEKKKKKFSRVEKHNTEWQHGNSHSFYPNRPLVFGAYPRCHFVAKWGFLLPLHGNRYYFFMSKGSKWREIQSPRLEGLDKSQVYAGSSELVVSFFYSTNLMAVSKWY
jgi:hypothetical protein